MFTLLTRRTLVRSAYLLLFVMVLGLLVASCTPDHPQSTFDTQGPVAKLQADLFNFVFVIATVVFVLVEGAVIYIVLRYRRRNNSMPKQVHGNTALEITWTIIPAIIIAIIAVPTISGIWTTARIPEEGLPVTAVGHQWWFEFRYPEQSIVTSNEMHIPAGEDIIITLQSEDVIHSFWVPKLAGKIDMVPINENRLWLRADRPGEYYGQCAEFCGIAHAHMRFRVIAHEKEEFEDWVNNWFVPPDPLTADLQEGQTLFAVHCSTCHTVNSHSFGSYDSEILQQANRWQSWQREPNSSLLVSAPNLTHFGDRTTIGSGDKPLTRENLIKWIENPASIKPGTRMQQNALVYRLNPELANKNTENPSAKLLPGEVEKIADYLLSLKPGAEASVSGDSADGLVRTDTANSTSEG